MQAIRLPRWSGSSVSGGMTARWVVPKLTPVKVVEIGLGFELATGQAAMGGLPARRRLPAV